MYGWNVKTKSVEAAIAVPKWGKQYEARRDYGTQFRGMKLYKALSAGLVVTDGWRAKFHFVAVWCSEHKRIELVKEVNFQEDLRLWYVAGFHPRFSIVGALIEAKQTAANIDALMPPVGNTLISTKLKNAKGNKKKFLKMLHPFLFTKLPLGPRRYSVQNRFKEKFLRKSFSVKDFFREENQELRRLMMRIVPIKEIIRKMRYVAQDKEGKLYHHARFGRHLYVVCPSTGQEYLLAVPERFKSPMEARRWTFGLERNATFAKEA